MVRRTIAEIAALDPAIRKLFNSLAAGAVVLALLLGLGLAVWVRTPPPMLTVAGNHYPTDVSADPVRQVIELSGENCWRDDVDVGVAQVTIRWSWVTPDLPAGLTRSFTEDAGSTKYGENRLSLDEDGCFSWENYPQPFPPVLVRDLADYPGFTGDMELLFTLVPTDFDDPADQVSGVPVYVTAGPFTIPAG